MGNPWKEDIENYLESKKREIERELRDPMTKGSKKRDLGEALLLITLMQSGGTQQFQGYH
ncbi:MAG: hypothetical protein RQ739_15450 [Desulfotignum sp.]|nr:hypothetical protein [Desulfotignum sp.]